MIWDRRLLFQEMVSRVLRAAGQYPVGWLDAVLG